MNIVRVYINSCIYVNIYEYCVCIHKCIYIYKRIYLNTKDRDCDDGDFLYACICACMNIFVVCIHANACILLHVCVYTCICIWCVYMHMYVH